MSAQRPSHRARRTLSVVGTAALVSVSLASAGLPRQAEARGSLAPALQVVERPHILLITTDDQRADEMDPMPVVRRELVAAGTTFTRAYAPFPLCCPARATLLSGQYPHNHGVLGNQTPQFPLGGYVAFDTSSSLATWLQDAGYQTAFVGKFINNYGAVKPVLVPPGWEDWHATVSGGNYFSTRLRESTTGANPVTRLYENQYQADLYADLATDIIRRRVDAGRPLFLNVSFFGPHSGAPREPDDPTLSTPAVAPRHRDAYAGTPLRRTEHDPSFNEADVTDKPAYVRKRGPLGAALQAQMTELYQQRLESLMAVDEAVDEILQALEAAGVLDETLVVFTSDNGYMLGEHRIHAGKTVPYEPSARVPFVVRGPGFPAGVERSQPVTLVDVAPTLLHAAGGTAGLPMDGTALQPYAEDPTHGTDRTVVIEAGPRSTTDGAPYHYRGLRTSRWLYVEYHETGEVELYDLLVDPYQEVNRARDPAYATERQQLADRLATLQDCSGEDCA